MISDSHAVRSVLRPLSSRSSDSIWISDALLAESIQRFTSKYRRHGSSVPGPLEARKRGATRRKNGGLAAVGRGGPQIDPIALFGPGHKVEWWNSPHGSAKEAGLTERKNPAVLSIVQVYTHRIQHTLHRLYGLLEIPQQYS
jgi:hypothetical protein